MSLNVLSTEVSRLKPARIVVLGGAESREFLVKGSECGFPSFGYEYSQNKGWWALVR